MPYQRVSPGIWRDSATGRTIRSAQDPNRAGGGQPQQRQQPRQQTPQGRTPQAGADFRARDVNINRPRSVIRGQEAANIEAAGRTQAMSLPNEFTPYGQMTQEIDPVTGQVTRRMGLSPEQQQLLSQEQGLESGANIQAQNIMGGGIYNQPFNLQGLPEAPGAQGMEPYRQQVMEGLYRDFEQQYEPQFQREKEELEQWAHNTGNPPGSPQYNARIQQMSENQNRARQSARANAMQQGREAVESSFGMGTQARQTALGERVLERDRPFQEVSGLMGLGQGVQNPNFTGFVPTSMQPVDVGGIAGQYAGMRSQERIANIGAGASAAASAAAMDRQRQEQQWAEDVIASQEDKESGGDTSGFVGGRMGTQPTRAAPRRGGSLVQLGQAARGARPRQQTPRQQPRRGRGR